MATRRKLGSGAAPGIIALIAAGIMLTSGHSGLTARFPAGSLNRDAARLISIQPLPVLSGSMCEWTPASAQRTLAAFLQKQESRPAGREPQSQQFDIAPVRLIQDEYATYSAVAVDDLRNEIVLQDENLFQILVYDRTASTPPAAKMTEPKRIIGGPKTKVEFNCGLYVDPGTGDIYSVNNDTTDAMVIFDRSAKGDVAPTRELHTPHGSYGIAVDEVHQEMFFTVEHDNALVAYRKSATGEEQPLRMIQGDHTQLADPHGIAVDAANSWIFVVNHGSTHRVKDDPQKPSPPNWPLTRSYAVPGRGESLPPSITVFDRMAAGDARPLRVIQGPKTQLDWPAQIYLDAARGELYVANDGGNSILVFRSTDQGDVAPLRSIRGAKTQLLNPTGVWVDTKNKEVVASSMGNHSALVFPLDATGDVAPLRVIRSAPAGMKALAIGNPGAVAYDSKRDELLVPN